jgi:hypothetical protein
VIRVRVGQPRVRIPAVQRDFSLLGIFQTGSGASSTSYSTATGVISRRCDVDHSPPSGAKDNEWSYTSAPPILLPGVDTDNFTFFYRYLRRPQRKTQFGVQLCGHENKVRQNCLPSHLPAFCNNKAESRTVPDTKLTLALNMPVCTLLYCDYGITLILVQRANPSSL